MIDTTPPAADPVVVVRAIRSPFGGVGGQLADWHPASLASLTISALLKDLPAHSLPIESVALGCASQVGAQGMNIARAATLGAGLPEVVSATSISSLNGCSLDVAHLATAVLSPGALSIAGGVEHMTQVPLGAATADAQYGAAYGPETANRYADAGGLQPPGVSAERIAKRAGLSRQELESYTNESKRRCLLAQKDGLFAGELVDWRHGANTSSLLDEMPAPQADIDASILTSCFVANGVVTSAAIAPPADGAAMLLLAHESTAQSLRLTSRAKILATMSAGANPVDGSLAAEVATRRLLAGRDLAIDDIDIIEIHEAFASVPLAWSYQLELEAQRCNLYGGALALGDPIGASGTRLVVSAINQLENTQGRYGLVVYDGAAGLATAMLIERSDTGP